VQLLHLGEEPLDLVHGLGHDPGLPAAGGLLLGVELLIGRQKPCADLVRVGRDADEVGGREGCGEGREAVGGFALEQRGIRSCSSQPREVVGGAVGECAQRGDLLLAGVEGGVDLRAEPEDLVGPRPRLLGRVLLGILELLQDLESLLKACTGLSEYGGEVGCHVVTELRGHEPQFLLARADRLVGLDETLRRPLLLAFEGPQLGGQGRATAEEDHQPRDPEDDQSEHDQAEHPYPPRQGDGRELVSHVSDPAGPVVIRQVLGP
jgi:hypothetical protein